MGIVIKGVKIKGTVGAGTGDPVLTRDAVSNDVGVVPNTVFSLPDANILVGNVSSVPTAVAVTGDITLSNTGVVAIASSVIVNADINASAAIDLTKLAPSTASKAAVYDVSGFLTASATSAVQVGYLSTTTSDVQTQINSKQATITGAASSIVTSNLTANKALVSDGSGKVTYLNIVSSTQLGYLSNVISDVQGQIDGKLTVSLASVADGDILYRTGGIFTNKAVGTNGQVLTIVGGMPAWAAGTSNGIPSGGTSGQYLVKTSGTDYDVSWDTLTLSKITDISASATDLNILSGLSATVSGTEIGYLDGVTSAIQTQLSSKLDRSLSYNSLFVGGGSNLATQLSVGTDGQVLTVVSGSPVWQTPTPPGNVSGPVSSTNNAIAKWNGTGGNAIQDTSVIIDASNNITGVLGLSATTLTSSSTTSASALTISTIPSNDNALTQVLVRDAGTGVIKYRTAASISGGVSDGDKGDITVSGSGTVWTIDNTVVTYAKIQNVTTDRLLGRDTAGSGSTEELTVSGGIEFTGSGGIQTSALTGDVTKTAGGTVTTIAANVVNFSKIQASASGLSVIGRSANTSGDFAEIVAASDHQIIRRSGTNIGFGSIDLAESGAVGTSILPFGNGGTGLSALGTNGQLLRVNAGATALEYFTPTYISGNQTITLSGDVSGSGATAITTTIGTNKVVDTMLRQSAGLSVIGRSANTTGNVTDITAVTDGHVLRLSGTTLGFGTIASAGIGASQVTYAKIQNVTNSRLLGNASGGSAAPSEITVSGLTLSSNTLTASAATVGAWALTGTSTLTGVATITSNTANQHVYNGTWTTTASAQYHSLVNPTITPRATVSDTVSAFAIRPSITATANSQRLSVLDLDSTLSDGGFTSVTTNLIYATTYQVDSNGSTRFGSALGNAPKIGAGGTTGFTVTNNSIRIEGRVANGTVGGIVLAQPVNIALTTGSSSAVYIDSGYNPSTGTHNHTIISAKPTYNQIGGTGTIRFLDYDPTGSGTLLGSHYGLLIRPSTTLSGFGLGTTLPSATMHVSGTVKFDLGSDATGDTFYRNSSGFLTRLAIGTTGYVLTADGSGVPVWSANTSVSSGTNNELQITDNAGGFTTAALLASSGSIYFVDTFGTGSTGLIAGYDGVIKTVLRDLTLQASDGVGGTGSDGDDVNIIGGNANGTNPNQGGNVFIKPGIKSSTGIDGNIALFSSTGSFGGGGKVISILNATTVPTTNPTGGGILYTSSGLPYWANTAQRTIIQTSSVNPQAGSYSMLVTDDIIGITSTAAPRTVTLPLASSVPSGKIFTIKDQSGGAGTNNITVARTSTDTIDGATSVLLNSNYQARGFYSNGTNWFTL